VILDRFARPLTGRVFPLTALLVAASGLGPALARPAAVAEAPGAGGGGGSGAPAMQERRIERDVGGDQLLGRRGNRPAVAITGRVLDGSGSPMRGIVIKLFSAGILVSSARSEPDGSFAIEGNPMIEDNVTTTLWAQSPDPNKYLDTDVYLHTGRVITEQKLLSPCHETVPLMGGAADVEIVLMTPDERRKAMSERDCLE
jgi:hypothetical protein